LQRKSMPIFFRFVTMSAHYRPLYTGCFGQHFLQTIWSKKVTADVHRKFCLVQGHVAGADGLAESEIRLAVETGIHHWNTDGDRTEEAIRNDLEEGKTMTDQEIGLLIWQCAKEMELEDPTPLFVAMVQYSLAISSADELTTTESDSLRKAMKVAGMHDDTYEKAVAAFMAEMQAYKLYRELLLGLNDNEMLVRAATCLL